MAVLSLKFPSTLASPMPEVFQSVTMLMTPTRYFSGSFRLRIRLLGKRLQSG